MISEPFRAFIAIDLPENIRSSLGEAQEILKAFGFRAKWVPPQNIHLTLKFLGNIDSDYIDKITVAMTSTAENFNSVFLSAREIGVFPNIRRPRKTAIDKLKGFETESFEINEIILFKSELRPTGAVYSKIQRVNFD